MGQIFVRLGVRCWENRCSLRVKKRGLFDKIPGQRDAFAQQFLIPGIFPVIDQNAPGIPEDGGAQRNLAAAILKPVRSAMPNLSC